MKKSLILGSLLMFAGSVFAVEPQVVDNFYSVSLSPDGNWWVGQSGASSMVIKDLANNKTYNYDEDDLHVYGLGSGNCVSNNGIVLGTTDNMNACYWQNGVWTELPILNAGTTNSANSILADGSVICGNVGLTAISVDASDIMAVPAVWYRQDDGTYGAPVLLPHPDFDFTGRIPQYVTAVQMSDDGKTIVGQVVDYSGFFCAPILYTCNDAGEWTYSYIHPELLNPSGVEFPEYPGEFDLVLSYEDFMTEAEIEAYNQAIDDYYNAQAGLVYPEPEFYMTDEEYAAYMAAMEEYYETWENYPNFEDYMSAEEIAAYNDALDEYYRLSDSLKYPEYPDYMTAEELAAYEAAKVIFDKAYDEWWEKYSAYDDAFNSCLADGYVFLFNNVRISSDGKRVATTREATVLNDDPMSWFPFKNVYYPVTFNLEDETYTQYESVENIVITYITDDYSVLASFLDTDYLLPRRAYIIPQMEVGKVLPLEDFVAETNPEVALWMKQNMTHQVPVGVNEETWDLIYEEYMCSGVPTSTPDMAVIATGIENSWDIDTPVNYFSYLIPGPGTTGADDVKTEGNNSVQVLAGGHLALAGEFASVTVYNIAGVAVFTAVNPGATVSTGLASGLYVVKAVTADGAALVKKVAF